VNQVEALAKEVSDAAAIFMEDTQLEKLSSDEIQQAVEAVARATVAANSSLLTARRYITTKQLEAKGKDGSKQAELSAELTKMQARLGISQTDVTKHKALSTGFEKRLAIKKACEDVAGRLDSAEGLVTKACGLIDELDELLREGQPALDEKSSDKTIRETEIAASEAQTALKVFSRYFEAQMRGSSTAIPKEQQEPLEARRSALQEKLERAVKEMKERSEQATVRGMLSEAEERVKECEDIMQKASDSELVFMKGDEGQAMEEMEGSEAMEGMEAAVAAGHGSIGTTKTFLAMKRLAAKRLSQEASVSALEQLAAFQERLEQCIGRLSGLRKSMGERKNLWVRHEAKYKTDKVEKLVEEASTATKLLDAENDIADEDAKGACEKAGSMQDRASAAIVEAKAALQSRQKEAKEAKDTALLNDIGNLFDKVKSSQIKLEKLKAQLRDHEHRFVAQRLLAGASNMIEQLQQKLEKTKEVAAPLISEEKREDFTAAIYLTHLVDAMKANLRETKRSEKEVVQQMCKDGKLEEVAFLRVLQEMPEIKASSDVAWSEEKLKRVFAYVLGKKESALPADMLEHFSTRFICTVQVSMTDALQVKGGKTVRKIEVNEIVEGLAEPEKDDAVGLMRVKAKAQLDEKEGYVTVASNTGTVYLDRYSAYSACQKIIDAALKEMQDDIAKVNKYIEQKTKELLSVKTGPLAETKDELQKKKPLVSKAQTAFGVIRKDVVAAKKRHDEVMEVEKRQQQEAAERKVADALTEKAETQAQGIEAKLENITPAAEQIVQSRGADKDDPVQAMTDVEASLKELLGGSAAAIEDVRKQLQEVRSAPVKGALAEARAQLQKIKIRLGAVETKAKKLAESIREARGLMAKDAHKALTSVLREHLRASAQTAEELFKKLSQDADEISGKSMADYVDQLPEKTCKRSHLDLAMLRYPSGITSLSLRGLLQEFHRCVKEIAITDCHSVKESKTLRKLEVGELVELLEPPRMDELIKAERARCRAMVDHQEGWVTLQGNQGSNFFECCAKPWYCFSEEVVVQAGFESGSTEVRKMQIGEVLETLEGPRKEPNSEQLRVKGKAAKDGKLGWVTLSNDRGSNLELVKLLVCKQSIALTTELDIVAGKAIRKLEVGETVELVEEGQRDEKRKILRAKVKAKKDDEEGWVTMEGNQGTKYIEESTKHYVCTRSAALERNFVSGCNALRDLEVDELFEVTDGPRKETKQGAERARGRTLGADAVEGWFTVTKKNVQPWAPRFTVLQSTAMHDKLELAGAKSVRRLDLGEDVEALEAPVREEKTGVMRVRARAEKDGVSGFVTVRGNQGTVILQPILAE